MGLRDRDVPLPESVKYIKNEEGRVFIATPVLRERTDMTACDKDGNPINVKRQEIPEFKLEKASKQQIFDEAKRKFSIELDVKTHGVKVLRQMFRDLENDHASKNDN